MGEDFQDKTEEATPRKLQEARKKGNVSKSQDLTMGVMLLGIILFFLMLSGFFFDHLSGLIVGIFQHLQEPIDSPQAVVYWAKEGIYAVLTFLGPFLVLVLVMGFFSNLLQIGWLFTFEKLKPKWERLNIFDASNWKRYFDTRVLMRTFLGMTKISIVGVVLYLMIDFSLPEVSRLIRVSSIEIYHYLLWKVFWMGIVVALFFIIVGAIDFIYQKHKYRADMKMTKQEIKDESRQSEGDPLVKSKLRSTMLSFVQSRMKSNVKHADVVITNPIHYAVAIQYDPEKMSAPMCVAKGARKLAESIKELAKEHKIPIIENPPLAQGLYRTIDVGMFVPPNFYHAIAEVLAYIYRLNEEKELQRLGPQRQARS